MAKRVRYRIASVSREAFDRASKSTDGKTIELRAYPYIECEGEVWPIPPHDLFVYSEDGEWYFELG